MALRGVGGFLTWRLKRIGWRLDLTPSPPPPPTDRFRPLLQLFLQLTGYPGSSQLLAMSGPGVHRYDGTLGGLTMSMGSYNSSMHQTCFVQIVIDLRDTVFFLSLFIPCPPALLPLLWKLAKEAVRVVELVLNIYRLLFCMSFPSDNDSQAQPIADHTADSRLIPPCIPFPTFSSPCCESSSGRSAII